MIWDVCMCMGEAPKGLRRAESGGISSIIPMALEGAK